MANPFDAPQTNPFDSVSESNPFDAPATSGPGEVETALSRVTSIGKAPSLADRLVASLKRKYAIATKAGAKGLTAGYATPEAISYAYPEDYRKQFLAVEPNTDVERVLSGTTELGFALGPMGVGSKIVGLGAKALTKPQVIARTAALGGLLGGIQKPEGEDTLQKHLTGALKGAAAFGAFGAGAVGLRHILAQYSRTHLANVLSKSEDIVARVEPLMQNMETSKVWQILQTELTPYERNTVMNVLRGKHGMPQNTWKNWYEKSIGGPMHEKFINFLDSITPKEVQERLVYGGNRDPEWMKLTEQYAMGLSKTQELSANLGKLVQEGLEPAESIAIRMALENPTQLEGLRTSINPVLSKLYPRAKQARDAMDELSRILARREDLPEMTRKTIIKNLGSYVKRVYNAPVEKRSMMNFFIGKRGIREPKIYERGGVARKMAEKPMHAEIDEINRELQHILDVSNIDGIGPVVAAKLKNRGYGTIDKLLTADPYVIDEIVYGKKIPKAGGKIIVEGIIEDTPLNKAIHKLQQDFKGKNVHIFGSTAKGTRVPHDLDIVIDDEKLGDSIADSVLPNGKIILPKDLVKKLPKDVEWDLIISTSEGGEYLYSTNKPKFNKIGLSNGKKALKNLEEQKIAHHNVILTTQKELKTVFEELWVYEELKKSGVSMVDLYSKFKDMNPEKMKQLHELFGQKRTEAWTNNINRIIRTLKEDIADKKFFIKGEIQELKLTSTRISSTRQHINEINDAILNNKFSVSFERDEVDNFINDAITKSVPLQDVHGTIKSASAYGEMLPDVSPETYNILAQAKGYAGHRDTLVARRNYLNNQIKTPQIKPDIPYEVRKEMNQIETAGYPVARTINDIGYKIHTGELFNGAASNPNLATVDEVVARTNGWIKLKEDPTLGKLSGMWVEPGVAKDIDAITKITTQSEKLYIKLLSAWKMGKTTGNLATHGRNLVSNTGLLEMSGVPIYRIPDLLSAAVDDVTKQTKLYKLAKEHGLGYGTFRTGEIEALRGVYSDKKNIVDIIDSAGSVLDKTFLGDMARLYQMEEEIFKMAKVRHLMEQGFTVKSAMVEADKWLFNYTKVPEFIRNLRTHPLGSPFLTFQYKAIPRVIEAAFKRPLDVIKYPIIMGAIEEYSKKKFNLSDEDMRVIKQGKSLSFVLPFPDENGNIRVFDLQYIVPYGEVFEKRKVAGHEMPTFGFMQNPVYSIPINLAMFNKDPYTGKEIVSENATEYKKTTQIFKYIGTQLMPPLTPILGAPAEVIRKAVEGRSDRYGVKTAYWYEVMGAITGMKTKPVNLSVEVYKNLQRSAAMWKDYDIRMGGVLKDQSLTNEERSRSVLELWGEKIRGFNKIWEGKIHKEVNPFDNPFD